ncbi:MAG: hypothetical protein AAGB32_00345 [Pseudomonadota bacterium]
MTKKTPTILMPTMGEGDMPDTQALADKLRAEGWSVIHADFSGDLQTASNKVDWTQIDIVDTRNMRGSLTNFTTYSAILDEINDQIRKQRRAGRVVTTTLDDRTIKWLSNKSDYLKKLEDLGVKIIPTTVISFQKDGIRDNPVSRRSAAENIYSKLVSSECDNWVIKPSTSALAKGLRFIDVDRDTGKIVITVTEPRQQAANDDAHQVTTTYEDKEAFIEAMAEYMRLENTHDGRFLLQEYVDNLETSAVFINGKAHYVERPTGPSHIAHGNFGGQDIPKPKKDIDPNIIQFVDYIRSQLPPEVISAKFLRIDVMQQAGNGLILGEIEGAGAARLWLGEAKGAIKNYTEMLKDMHAANAKATKTLGRVFETRAGGAGVTIRADVSRTPTPPNVDRKAANG